MTTKMPPGEGFADSHEHHPPTIGGLSIIGDDHARWGGKNEDYWANNELFRALAVGDGLGSSKDADRASEEITKGFVDAWREAVQAAFDPETGDPQLARRWNTSRIAAHCVAEANHRLWNLKDKGLVNEAAKTTLTGLVCDGVGFANVQIGDSLGVEVDGVTEWLFQLAGGAQTHPDMPWAMYNSIGGPNRGGRQRDASDDRIEWLPLAEGKPTRILQFSDGVLKGLDLWYEEEDPPTVMRKMVRHIASLRGPQEVADFMVQVIARGRGRKILPDWQGDDATAGVIDLPPAPSELYLPDDLDPEPPKPRIVIPQLRLVFDEDWDPNLPPPLGGGAAARRTVGRSAGHTAVRRMHR